MDKEMKKLLSIAKKMQSSIFQEIGVEFKTCAESVFFMVDTVYMADMRKLLEMADKNKVLVFIDYSRDQHSKLEINIHYEI